MPAGVKRPRAEAEEEDFPRGGASVLTPLEQRKAKLEAQADVEKEIQAEKAGGKQRTKKKRKEHAEDARETTFFKTELQAGKVPKFVELLRFSNLTVGAKVWGGVQEVTAKRLVVSLPHGLRGFVAAEDASDVLRSLRCEQPSKADKSLRKALAGVHPFLPDLFYPGQLVRCKIIALDGAPDQAPDAKSQDKSGRKRIHLSLCLSDVCSGCDESSLAVGAVLAACVRTNEDHGCVCDVGVPGVAAFLPADAYDAAFGPGAAAPTPGQLLQVVVKDRQRDGKSVVLDCDAAAVAAGGLEAGGSSVALRELLPGQLVTATVRAILSDGLLVSFLRFFHGVVDHFNLPLDLPSNWKASFSENQRLKARIVYVPPLANEATPIRLTFLKNLIGFHGPPTQHLPQLGGVYRAATVQRTHDALGLVVRLPTDHRSLAFVHISNVEVPGADETSSAAPVTEKKVTEKKGKTGQKRGGKRTPADAALSKAFPAGMEVDVKVIGYRLMETMAVATMRRTALETSEVSWSSVAAAQVLHGVVHAVEDWGLTVQLGPAVRGVVALAHVSEAAAPKSVRKRFKVGQTVQVRVLEVDSNARRLRLTLKKGLIDSKLPPVADAAAVPPGTRTHGFVTGVSAAAGVFVAFYNNVKGLVAPAQAGLEPGVTLEHSYAVGQVLKVTVIGADPRRGLRLSLLRGTAVADAIKDQAAAVDRKESALSEVCEGQILKDARVVRVMAAEPEADPPRPQVFYLEAEVAGGGIVAARLAPTHLSDHPYAARAIAGALQEGMVLPEVLVLEVKPSARLAVVSCKHEMLEAARRGELPQSAAQLSPGQVRPGFVASVTAEAVFVRFAGSLTGRAGVTAVADTFVSDLKALFSVGQSVMAVVRHVVDEAAGRFTVSLKPSLVGTHGIRLLHTLFRDLEFAARLAGADDQAPELGSILDATVQAAKPYGLVCDLDGFGDLVGLISSAHLPDGAVEVGAKLAAVVLDVHPVDGIVDLSAQERVLDHVRRRRQALCIQPGDTCLQASVELVKSEAMFLVASVCRKPGRGFAFVPACDFNQQHDLRRQFKFGQGIECSLPAAVETPGQGATGRGAGGEKGGRGEAALGFRERPVYGGPRLVLQTSLDAVVSTRGKKRGGVKLEVDPGSVVDPVKDGDVVKARIKELSGRGLTCVLKNKQPASVPLTLLHDEFVSNALTGLATGTWVEGKVVKQEEGVPGGRVQLSLRQKDGGSHPGHSEPPAAPAAGTPDPDAALAPQKGDTLHAYVRHLEPPGSKGAGLFLSLDASTTARVKLKDLGDDYIQSPQEAFPDGKHVVGRVLAVQPDGRVDVTLKSKSAPRSWMKREDLKEGQVVGGVVKRVEPFGVFVAINNSNLSGLAHVSELQDGFVKDPSEHFTPGAGVRAVVLALDHAAKRISLGLKPSYFVGSGTGDAEGAEEAEDGDEAAQLHGEQSQDEGEDGKDLSGLDLEDALAAAYDESDDDSDAQMAEERGLRDAAAATADGSEDEGDAAAHLVAVSAADSDEGSDEVATILRQKADEAGASESGSESDDGDEADTTEAGMETDDTAGVGGEGASGLASGRPDSAPMTSTGELDAHGWNALMLPLQEAAPDEAQETGKRVSSKARRKARAAEEAAIRKKELARLQAAAPSSVEDFERLVVQSPNSSYVWIKYMAHLLSVRAVDKARAIAERALQTIDYREDQEKLNVWVAFLGLEDSFAEDPEAASASLLSRALQYTDAKKMYLAAMDTFARSGRTDQVLTCSKALRRRFGTSCKVWLRLLAVEFQEEREPGAFVERAVAALPARKHLKFLQRVALAEFRDGSVERGRAVFERLVSIHPKRTDVWGVYIDQEVKAGGLENVRNLFERAIHLDLAPKKMRFFFKRYVQFESDVGDRKRVEYVKQRAMEYIRSIGS